MKSKNLLCGAARLFAGLARILLLFIFVLGSLPFSQPSVTVLADAGSLRVMCENDPSLVGCWRMDDGSGSSLLDGSPAHTHDATLINSPLFGTPGKIGTHSLILIGTSQYASIPDDPAFAFTTSLTVSIWLKPVVAADQGLMVKSSGSAGFELALSVSNSSDPPASQKVFFRLNGDDSLRVNSETAYPTDGSWLHAAAVYDGSTLRLYINGVQESSLAASTPVSSNTATLILGANSEGSSGWFTGELDDARLYNRALSDTEIAALASNAPPGDTTPPAAPTSLSATPGDGSIQLNWTSPSDPDVKGYNVYRRLTAETYPPTPLIFVTGESQLDNGLSNGTEYFYTIKAVDTSNNESAASTEASAIPAAPIPCYLLTLNGDANGSPPTTAPNHSPICAEGRYTAGESITLTAAPNPGYRIAAWSGTNDDALKTLTNTLTMPAADHAVSATYRQNQKPVIISSSPADQAGGITTSVNLSATVQDADLDSLRVKFYGRIKPADFTLVVLPDTQTYSADPTFDTYSTIFNGQTGWIVNNLISRNIVFTAHLGDVVNSSYRPKEWTRAETAMNLLDAASIPYILAVGNNDQNPANSPGSTSEFNNSFGTSRFAGKAYYGGHYGSTNDNSYAFFSAGGMDFTVISLEYDPSPDPLVLAWADQLLTSYSSRRAIIVTHDLLTYTNTLSTQGQAIFDALKSHSNLFLMLGGHLDTTSRITLHGTAGNPVYAIRSDYQTLLGGKSGYLRIMTFSPTQNRIRVETYSPNQDLFITNSDNQFTLDYTMDTFTQIGGDQTVASGNGTASVEWSGLVPGNVYEWYAIADDGMDNGRSSTRSFTSTAPTPIPVNTPPVIVEGASVSVSMSRNGSPTPFQLTLHAADPDPGDHLSWSIATPALHGTAQAGGTGNSQSIAYTPQSNFSGFDQFTVQVSDGKAADTITIMVSIQTNAPPLQGITISGNAGAAGVKLSYLDGIQKTVSADSRGYYSFKVPENWSGTVSPSLSGYTFNPSSRSYARLSSDQSKQDYTAFAGLSSLNCTELTPQSSFLKTGEPPQSAIWTYFGGWFAVFPRLTMNAATSGMWLWQLQNKTWTPMLKLSGSTQLQAEVKPDGALAHILLFDKSEINLISVEFRQGAYQPWGERPSPAKLKLASTSAPHVELDSTGRLWLVARQDSPLPAKIVVYFSDSPYQQFQGPVELVNGVTGQDQALIAALPGNRIGVLWSAQKSVGIGFQVHRDGDPPAVWSTSEFSLSGALPGSGNNKSTGSPLSLQVSNNGTLYAVIRSEGSDTKGTGIALLVRRANGAWDPAVNIDPSGTNPILTLDETHDLLRIIFTSNGAVVYRQSPLAAFALGPQTLLSAGASPLAAATKTTSGNEWVILKANGTGLQCASSDMQHADLAVTQITGVTQVLPGGAITYMITAANAGPDAIPRAIVSNLFPGSLENIFWTCNGENGGSCVENGSGNIDDNTVQLPAGATVTYTVSATIRMNSPSLLTNIVTAVGSSGVIDPNWFNNLSVQRNTVITFGTCGFTPRQQWCRQTR